MTTSNHLQKYVPPTITPAGGGALLIATTDGLPGYQPKLMGGFYPTTPYAALRTFINGEGVVEEFPQDYVDFRLRYDYLLQQPPLNEAEKTQLVENHLRGQFDVARPYVYLMNWFNTWEVGQSIPITLPTPEAYIQLLPFGWGAGAVTADGFVDGIFTFGVDQGAYAVVGVAAPSADPGDPNAANYGFLFRSYQTVVGIERGVQVALTGANYALRTNRFAIQVVRGVVKYLINGVAVRTTTVPVGFSAVWSGFAALYGANSVVRDATLTQYSGSANTLPALVARYKGAFASLPALRGAGGWTPYSNTSLPAMSSVGGEGPYAASMTRLPRLAANSHQYIGNALPALRGVAGAYSAGASRLPRLVALGAETGYAASAATLPAIDSVNYVGRTRPFGGMVSMPRIRSIGVGRSGAGGVAVASLPALIGRSANFSSAAVTLHRLEGMGYEDPAGEAFIPGAPIASAPISSVDYIIVVMGSSGSIVSVTGVSAVLDGTVNGVATITGPLTASAVLQALMDSALIGASFQPMSEQGAETWVVNADSGASSSYENFAFNSFATIDGKLHGVRADGLYLLEGDTDDGVPIRASLSFGSTDFATEQLKRMEYATIGVASSGTIYLKVKVRGGEIYTYSARRSDDFMAIQRIDIGRGIRASYLGFELYNSDGCDFELNTVSFHAAELTRRI